MKDLVLSVRERDSFCHVTCLEHVRISCSGMDTRSVISDSDVTAILSTIILWRNDKYDLLMIRRRDQTESYWRWKKNASAIDDVSFLCDGFVKRLKSSDVDVLNFSNESISWACQLISRFENVNRMMESLNDGSADSSANNRRRRTTRVVSVTSSYE